MNASLQGDAFELMQENYR